MSVENPNLLLEVRDNKKQTMPKVTIHLGENLPPNLIRLFNSIEKIVDDNIGFTVVGTSVDREKLPENFDYYEVQDAISGRGLTRIVATYRRMNTYLNDPDENPDAVWQITSPQFHAVPVIAAARRHRIPVATRIPGNKLSEYREQRSIISTGKTFILNNILLRALRYSNKVVTLSTHNKNRLVNIGIPASKIEILRPPLDTDLFSSVRSEKRAQIKTDLGYDQDAYCPLYIGRLSELKGMADMENVLARFEGNENYEFHFVGSGEFESRLEEYDNTVLHGFVDPKKIHRHYKAADLYVHPSYVEEDGISWTMMEAAATELPVVARDVDNAATISSYVFNDTSELASYLSEPSRWTSAVFPTLWSLEELRPAYNAFLDELVGNDGMDRKK